MVQQKSEKPKYTVFSVRRPLFTGFPIQPKVTRYLYFYSRSKKNGCIFYPVLTAPNVRAAHEEKVGKKGTCSWIPAKGRP